MTDRRIRVFQLATNPVCAAYRFDYVRDHLNAGPRLSVTRVSQFTQHNYRDVLQAADILIVQRLWMSDPFTSMRAAFNDRGALVVYDIDDDLMHLHPDARYSRLAPPGYGQQIKEAIKVCQAVQCSTRRLSQVVGEFHPEIAVLENQLDEVPPLIEKDRHGPLVIGFAAGEDHLLDWLPIRAAFNQVVAQLEAANHDLQVWIVGDEQVFQSVASQRKRLIPLLSRNDYLKLLQQIDILLIPLADFPFNHSKSDVKFLESAACGAVALASNVVYADTIQHGKTGLLFGNFEQLHQGLTSLVENAELRRQIRRNAHQYVAANRLIEQHAWKWEAAYVRWYEQKQQLLSRSVERDR